MPATADREVLNFNAGPTALPAPVVERIHGGRYQRAYWADGHAEPRSTLSVTITVNHDVVDGAPGARFAETFGRLLEGGAGLDDGFLAAATELRGVGHALAR